MSIKQTRAELLWVKLPVVAFETWPSNPSNHNVEVLALVSLGQLFDSQVVGQFYTDTSTTGFLRVESEIHLFLFSLARSWSSYI